MSRPGEPTPLMLRITLTCWTFPVWSVMVTSPTYVPVASPSGFANTVRVVVDGELGAVPEDGETCSHGALAEVATVKPSGDMTLLTEMVCGCGIGPPLLKLNDSELGATISEAPLF